MLSRHTNEEIKTPFPEEKYKSYLKLLGFSTDQKLDGENVKKIFLTVIYDFTEGQISLDELSSIGGFLSGYLPIEDQFHTKLGDALNDASELTYYVRHVDDKVCADTFIWFMQNILEYYDSNRTNS